VKRSFKNILEELAKTPDSYVLGNRLPDGHGRAGRATGMTLSDMRKAGLVTYGRNQAHSLYGYRITELGLEQLASAENSDTADRSITPR